MSPNVRYQKPSRSCKCAEEGCFGKDCCGVHAGRYRGYIRGQLARTCGQVPLYECNRFCQCGPECENRLIQKGVQVCQLKVNVHVLLQIRELRLVYLDLLGI